MKASRPGIRSLALRVDPLLPQIQTHWNIIAPSRAALLRVYNLQRRGAWARPRYFPFGFRSYRVLTHRTRAVESDGVTL